MQYEPLDDKNWTLWGHQIIALESTVYEASRQDNPETLQDIICHPKSASLIAHDQSSVAGFCLGGPIELFPHVRGPSEDLTRGHFQTLYSADTCVAPIFQGRGIGRKLKLLQRTVAKTKGYRFISGRNRAVLAQRMWRLNRSLGARPIHIIEGDYQDNLTPDICIYYSIHL
jgi:ribosomal protein S18 acetylase RimI-like enzyme